MRTIVWLMVWLAVGCTSSPTLEELEDEALRTGNWEAVERRERLMERRNGPAAPNCAKGQTKYCVEDGFSVECTCTGDGGSP